jgi:hypothetical protein
MLKVEGASIALPNPSDLHLPVPGRTTTDLPRLITFEQLWNIYRISRTSGYELIAGGQIDSVKIGRRRLIDVPSVETFVESLKADVANGPAGTGRSGGGA